MPRVDADRWREINDGVQVVENWNSADRRALSPLFWTHGNPYGRFELDMNSHLELAAAAAAATVPGPRTAPGATIHGYMIIRCGYTGVAREVPAPRTPWVVSRRREPYVVDLLDATGSEARPQPLGR
ncbi:transposase [Streptomyces sp. NBC_00669]|uniref:hypothetical protein n=1 Tax=Streptomyces sp. NBC_00669 TaxID=2976011 RepID=UPI002E30429F|nr:hypothetical protein [Streptomyces sp. NBC_00669]